MALQAISRVFKNRYKDFESSYQRAISSRLLDMFSQYGHANQLPFTKQGFIIAIMSLGRLHENYKKNSGGEKYTENALLNVLTQEIKILRQGPQAEPGILLTPQDLNDFMNGVRELQLRILDDAMVVQLASDTRAFLERHTDQQSRSA